MGVGRDWDYLLVRPAIGREDSTIEYSTECICSVLVKLFTPNVEHNFLLLVERDINCNSCNMCLVENGRC